MKKLIGFGFVITGIMGLLLAMNENTNHINFIGAMIFGLSCLFGAMYAKDELHPVLWILAKWEYTKSRFIFWRL